MGGGNSVEEVQNSYWNDLEMLRDFHNRQSGGVFVGEWTLAGQSLDAAQNQQLSSWLVWCMAERSLGSIYWNFDAPIAEWSLKGSHDQFNIDWRNMPKPQLFKPKNTLSLKSYKNRGGKHRSD